jgi:hypothetical protein
VSYSSILNAPWDMTTGQGSPPPNLRAIAPVAGGLIVVGEHHGKADETLKPVPTAKPPAWGNTEPTGAGVIMLIRTLAPTPSG